MHSNLPKYRQNLLSFLLSLSSGGKYVILFSDAETSKKVRKLATARSTRIKPKP